LIKITIDDEPTLDLLKSLYANKLNAASRGARFAMNAKKRAFKEAVRLTAKVEGEPATGDPVLAIYIFTLQRIDHDAPIKAVQDAIESIGIACKNDRVIRFAWTFLIRPGTGTRYRPPAKRQVQVMLYDVAEEKAEALEQAAQLLDYCQECWLK
jgi:hypothetical protein